MEKKSHSALPSNYVTLAQLQERWLKEKERKEREKELQEKQEQQQKLPQQKLQQNRQERDRDQHRAKRTTQTQRRVSDSRTGTGNRLRKEVRPKILSVSHTNRFAIELSSENHEKLEAKVEILGDNADKDSKDNKLEKIQKVKRNQRADKDKEEKGTTQGTVEATTKGKIDNFEVKRGREKTAIKNELNHEDVEEKFRGLSMRCESDKQNGRFRRPHSDFRSTHRNYGNGGSHSYRSYHGRFTRREGPKPIGYTMVWVRKDGATSGGNIAGIETSSGSPIRDYCQSSDTWSKEQM